MNTVIIVLFIILMSILLMTLYPILHRYMIYSLRFDSMSIKFIFYNLLNFKKNNKYNKLSKEEKKTQQNIFKYLINFTINEYFSEYNFRVTCNDTGMIVVSNNKQYIILQNKDGKKMEIKFDPNLTEIGKFINRVHLQHKVNLKAKYLNDLQNFIK